MNRLHNPQLAGGVGAFPLMNAGAVGDTGAVQIHHLAGKAVLDAVDALARTDEAPLLPLGVDIIPQLDLGAIVGVVILDFNHLAVGGGDGIELALADDGLLNFLNCHSK